MSKRFLPPNATSDGAQRDRKESTGMPKAGPVKVTRADGTVEIFPAFRGGSTKNVGIYKTS